MNLECPPDQPKRGEETRLFFLADLSGCFFGNVERIGILSIIVDTQMNDGAAAKVAFENHVLEELFDEWCNSLTPHEEVSVFASVAEDEALNLLNQGIFTFHNFDGVPVLQYTGTSARRQIHRGITK
jgi:hypothetical protein